MATLLAAGAGAIGVQRLTPMITARLGMIPLVTTPIGSAVVQVGIAYLLSMAAKQFASKQIAEGVLMGGVAIAGTSVASMLLGPAPLAAYTLGNSLGYTIDQPPMLGQADETPIAPQVQLPVAALGTDPDSQL